MMIANEYGHYSKIDMADRLHGDIAHFAQKHGVIPNVVIMHPDNMPEVGKSIEIEGKHGAYTIQFMSDYRQRRSTYTIARVNDGK